MHLVVRTMRNRGGIKAEEKDSIVRNTYIKSFGKLSSFGDLAKHSHRLEDLHLVEMLTPASALCGERGDFVPSRIQVFSNMVSVFPIFSDE